MAHMYQQHRRYPFTDAVNHPVNHGHPPPTPPKPAIYQKQQHQAVQIQAPAPPIATDPQPAQNAPGSPPLPRQNAKITPPSPPRIICDKGGRYQLQRVGFLGEGGFARVYEVKDHRDVRFACKVVTKASLKTKKAKTKLYAEIKIHRSLTHPNIVNFHDCFEDQDNVYMTLELCPSGSLMDMLRRRRRFTELEARVFMIQLIGACHYMHTHQVIHRDLKLGNLFLDGRMNIKVGDFGLAALIENPGERKKTICGTPNYIAPEVLFDTVNGHSFEVDTWSVGVILYTLIVGRPPFQTKDVKAIYKRIRDNDYDFPSHAPPSSHAQNLIQQILTPDPSCRPTLHDILDHDFFVLGPVPAYIPSSAHDAPPYFGHIPKSVSDTNLRRLRRNALLDEPLTSINVPRPNAEPEPAVPSSSNSAGSVSGAPGRTIASSIAQQEKEFQKAVQPGSPISALLSSARQPLLVSASSTGNLRDKLERDAKDSPLLMRKLQTVQRESPLRRVARAEAVDGAEDEESRARKKELESQKARIVAQMAPVREEDEEDEGHVAAAHALPELKREEPQPLFQAGKEKVKGWERRVHSATTQRKEKEAENMPPPATQRAGEKVVSASSVRSRVGPSSSTTTLPPSSTTASLQKLTPATTSTASLSSHSRKPSINLGTSTSGSTVTLAPGQVPQLVASAGFDAFGATLAHAFTCKAAGKLFRDPQIDVINPLPEERVFIVSWVDYCNKYGMGYALTDGTVGVYFNDSTTTVLSPDKTHLDYIATRKVASATGTVSGPVYVRKSYTVTQHPEELKTKVYLVRQFEKYIMDRLYGDYDWTFVDKERSRGMEWVVKYLRMQNIIVFRLSNDILQFNFNDHSKLVLSSQGLLVTHIDKNYRLTRWPLSEVIATSLRYAEPRGTVGVSPDQIKFNQKLVDKLKYCKEILLSIKSATSGAGTEGKA